jgi:hypothetical protein
MNPAPIVLFVYNRLWHTKQTIDALQKNELARKSELFIYSDAAKNEKEQQAVSEVREFIKSVDGFKNITIIERVKNWGLADSIIDGVTTVINQYGTVIVLEDDIVVSQHFLAFMNKALNIYVREKKVWHISGWSYHIDTDGLSDTFFWRVMNCWGWATWKDRWQYFEKNPEKLINTWDIHKIYRFNLDGTCNFWDQVIENFSGKLNTWAIFWYASIFENEGLCLNPTSSLVHNIGHDGSGENCEKNNIYKKPNFLSSIDDLPNTIKESHLAVNKIKEFYIRINLSLPKRIILNTINIIKNLHD